MKMLFRRMFTKVGGLWQGSCIDLSDKWVKSLWHVPKSAISIWISVYDRPSSVRYKAEIRIASEVDDSIIESFPVIVFDIKEKCKFTHPSLDRFLRPYMNKVVHVQLEYIEK